MKSVVKKVITRATPGRSLVSNNIEENKYIGNIDIDMEICNFKKPSPVGDGPRADFGRSCWTLTKRRTAGRSGCWTDDAVV